jgi:lipopolysaccharide export LptBFGC system permease protein LptF
MGTYTEHWKQYAQRSKRKTLMLLLYIVVALPGTALIAYLIGLTTGEYPVLVHIALLLVWLVIFALLAFRVSKVVCPRCGTGYSRGRGLCNCPECGLRMLQEDG